MSAAPGPSPADELPTPARPARKDRRTWCKGRVGRDHILVIGIPDNGSWQKECGWTVRRYVNGWPPDRWYRCRHVELCSKCGKVFRRNFGWIASDLKDEECPAYTPLPRDPQ